LGDLGVIKCNSMMPIRSLAYAMGHKVETLRQMYERCTPEEKRRPIEEAIEELLLSCAGA
jgi:hypothetical protein